MKKEYSLFRNIGYAVKLAWKHSKLLVLLPPLCSLLDLCMKLVQLFLAPVVLQKVEQTVALGELLGTICLFTLALLLCRSLKAYLEDIRIIGHSRLQDALSLDLLRHGCMTSYPNQFDPEFRGKQNDAFGATVGNPNNSVYGVFSQLMELASALVGFILYLRIMRRLSAVPVITVILTTAVGYLAGKLASDWEYRHRKESVEIRLHRNYVINLAMGNEMPKDIRLFGMKDWLDDIYGGIVTLWRSFCARRDRRYLAAKLTDVAMTVVRNAVAYVCLIEMAIDGRLTASEFLLCFSAVSGFTAWIETILNRTADLHKSSRNISDFRAYFEWPEPFRFEGGRPISAAEDGRYELKLENVSFRYPGAQSDTICNMNLTVRPGEKLAVVGLNGAGKTTLIKLMCGLLDPTQGRILLNGQNIREFNRREYYSLFTAVFQDFSRLQASIAQNVAQSVTEIDEERLRFCIEQAGLTSAVEALPQGVETMLGRSISDNGVELSGGQMQRLMLARALYKNAPILLLDEPTAALDPIAENEIYQKYHAMTGGRTAVYISHRLASTRFCDRIVYLAGGRIAEEGTHEELMALSGSYCDLFRVQSKYYREGEADEG